MHFFNTIQKYNLKMYKNRLKQTGFKTNSTYFSKGIIMKTTSPGKNEQWPVLTSYTSPFLSKIAMPIGGIGTGTVSLGGRGDLRDWEIMNRPDKGFNPCVGQFNAPFFALWCKSPNQQPVTRLLEGQIPFESYEGSHGINAPNHGLPRFRDCTFKAAYPLAQVLLTDPDIPLHITLQAFNPLVPADSDASGIPTAVLRYSLKNPTQASINASIAGTISNFTGVDPHDYGPNSQPFFVNNRNEYRSENGLQGLYFSNDNCPEDSEFRGTIALITMHSKDITYKTYWPSGSWNTSNLLFWDDFSDDGRLEDSVASDLPRIPAGSLAVPVTIPPGSTRDITFLLTWHFPNRKSWTIPKEEDTSDKEKCDKRATIGNYYTTHYTDAWDVAQKTVTNLPHLEKRTVSFVNTLCDSSLPHTVKEAALYNISTLRTQTCFRTPDGRFFGYEGCCDRWGCCHGSCTHVWNYEQALAFLFGELSTTMREVEFRFATKDDGYMPFRKELPLEVDDTICAAADGQMGTIMKLYRDWQLSGDDDMLRSLWPKAKKALAFCWIEGGWDADRDGVMEGCQHNTMDVEYFGPNPQMTGWYLGALRAAEQMAKYLGDTDFSDQCNRLFTSGSKWMDTHLFNGEYYDHKIVPPSGPVDSKFSMKKVDYLPNATPPFQIGPGCLVDQLVGQYMAHICGLGYLHQKENVQTTLGAIMKYNFKETLHDHFNKHRTFALQDEAAVVMCTYPHGNRPEIPFPYFSEVMTGFEYTAAIGMLYEGAIDDGVKIIEAIRKRYDGQKRNPFNEAECGSHYARAMTSWGAVLALTGFHYSAVTKTMRFNAPAEPVEWFWSTGYAWGKCILRPNDNSINAELFVSEGSVSIAEVILTNFGSQNYDNPVTLEATQSIQFTLQR